MSRSSCVYYLTSRFLPKKNIKADKPKAYLLLKNRPNRLQMFLYQIIQSTYMTTAKPGLSLAVFLHLLSVYRQLLDFPHRIHQNQWHGIESYFFPSLSTSLKIFRCPQNLDFFNDSTRAAKASSRFLGIKICIAVFPRHGKNFACFECPFAVAADNISGISVGYTGWARRYLQDGDSCDFPRFLSIALPFLHLAKGRCYAGSLAIRMKAEFKPFVTPVGGAALPVAFARQRIFVFGWMGLIKAVNRKGSAAAKSICFVDSSEIPPATS